MESRTYIKYIRISPKKLRFILDDVRRMRPVVALSYLDYSPKRSSKVLYKVIKSALDAAVINLKTENNMLQFKTLAVSEGPFLKRMRPGARGMAKMYKKRSSQVLVVLEIATQEAKAKTKKMKIVSKVATDSEKAIISKKKVSKTKK